MKPIERRCRRSDETSKALFYQLDACRVRAGLDAMVLADLDGLCVAASGDAATCDEFAAQVAMIDTDTLTFAGTIDSEDQSWDVQVRRFDVAGIDLYMCAVGGSTGQRAAQIEHSIAGVARILA